MVNLNCILVLSDLNRKDMRDNISDLTVYGVKIVSDIREVTRAMITETNKVVIIGNYSYDGVSELLLYREVLGLEYFYIGTDQLLVNLMGEYCSSYKLDYTSINSNLLYSVIYNDEVMQKEFEVRLDFKDIEEKVEVIHNNTRDPVTKELCDSFLTYREFIRMVLSDKKENEKLLAESRDMCTNLMKQRDNMALCYEDLLSKVITHQKVLSDYEIILTKDIYDKVGLIKYANAPKVLYIKEYQELIHMESLLDTLCRALRLQCNQSVKLVRLHDSQDLNRIKILEDSYKVVRDNFLISDIVSNDKVLSVGSYIKLMDLLLTNKYKLDILIIVDCKFYNQSVLSGNYLFLNAVRNRSNISKLGLGTNNTITNNPNDLLCWTEDEVFFDDSLTEEEKFILLSAKPVIKRLISMIRG